MKSDKNKAPGRARAQAAPAGSRSAQAAALPAPAGVPRWQIGLAVCGVLALALLIYAPALNGPFLFDDRSLPFMDPNTADQPIRGWLGFRHLLMFTFWLTYQIWGLDPEPYHTVNVLLHGFNSILAFAVLRRLLRLVMEPGARTNALALAGAAIFLAHPVQTEAVAYVASRSEVLSVLLVLSAFLLYLRKRGGGVGWAAAAGIMLLFVAAIGTKEHTLALPAVILWTDVFWGRFEAVRRNWRLYALMALGATTAAYPLWLIYRYAPTIGFKIQDLAWHQYLFTQFRAIWTYLRLYVLPVGLNADYDMPISRTLFDRFAWLGLIGLLGLLAAAWRFRRSYPLASYGFIVFLLFLAPTSSIVPIRDVLAERRMYLPFIGLLLITLDFARRLNWTAMRYAGAAAVLTVALGATAYARNRVWSDPLLFWQDTVAKSPGKARPHFHLAYMLHHQAGNCAAAIESYSTVARLEKPTYELLVDWALALDCAGRPGEAVAKLRQAAALEATGHVYATLGMVLGKQGRNPEALEALAKATERDPRFLMAYVYRGNVYMQLGQPAQALTEYQRALAIDPANETARQSIALAQRAFPSR